MMRFVAPLCLLIASVLVLGQCTGKTEPDRKVVFIIVDGISADILEQIDTPNIDRVIEKGAFSWGWLGGIAGEYSQSPTVSAVGYNHLLTATWSNKHNVYNNDIEDPNYNYWNIFRLFKHNHPDKEVAVYSSWLENRTHLIGHGRPEAGNVLMDIYYDGFELDTLNFPHEYAYVQRVDEHVSHMAAQSIYEDGPWLSWVYLWYPDDTGHSYGEVEEHFESIRVADAQVGRILDAVEQREREYNEEWLFVVTTDHGRRLPDGRHHGGQSERERTIWIATSNPEVNTYFRESLPAITDIYPTIARYLDLEIPRDLAMELDGVPFMGPLSISDADIGFDEAAQTIALTWDVWEPEGNVKVWLSTENRYASGERDTYELAAEVPVADGQVTFNVGARSSDFYKVVLEAPHNKVNRWVVR